MRDNYIEALNYNKETELAHGFICYAKLFCADWNKEYYKNLALQVKLQKMKELFLLFVHFQLLMIQIYN